MSTPTYPGAELLAAMPSLGLSVGEAAAQLGVTRGMLSRILHGHSAVSPDMALRLEKWLGWSALDLVRAQAEYDLWQARQRATEEA